jgi:hypothetical protein
MSTGNIMAWGRTKNALIARGATSNQADQLDPSLRGLKTNFAYPKNYPDVVHIKGELGAVNYGLRRGTVGIVTVGSWPIMGFRTVTISVKSPREYDLRSD